MELSRRTNVRCIVGWGIYVLRVRIFFRRFREFKSSITHECYAKSRTLANARPFMLTINFQTEEPVNLHMFLLFKKWTIQEETTKTAVATGLEISNIF